MSQEDWEDLLHDLVSDNLTADEKSDQRYKLAAHMAKLENELAAAWAAMESLKRRVASLEARANGGEP